MSRRSLLVASAGLTALALVPFAIPQEALPSVPTEAEWAVHAVAFALGALMWTLARPRAWPWVVAGGLAVGAAVEGVQACCIPGRGGEWSDLGFDAAGLAVGLAVAWVVLRVRRPPQPGTPRRGASGRRSNGKRRVGARHPG